MKRVSLLLALAVLLSSQAFAAVVDTLKVANYNVENLYDADVTQPINALTGEAGDADFSPQSWRRWTEERYYTKLENLAWVFSKMQPDICILEEVENLRVLKDLSNTIKRVCGLKLAYIAHTDSSDPRGIDVAILSRYPVKLVRHEPLKGRRGQLLAEIEVDGTVVYVIANHWKSQIGDAAVNIEVRTSEAQRLRSLMLSLLRDKPNASIIAGGDFNEDLDGPAIKKGLDPSYSRLDALVSLRMELDDLLPYNLIADIPAKARGSYYYARRKVWNSFDQLIVAPAMLRPMEEVGPAWRVGSPSDTKTFKLPELCFGKDGRPNSYKRVRVKGSEEQYYTNGYSDHFPVLTTLHRAPATSTAEDATESVSNRILRGFAVRPYKVSYPQSGRQRALNILRGLLTNEAGEE